IGKHLISFRPLGTVSNPLTGSDDAVVQIESTGRSWYDALLLSAETRASSRVSLLASYTLSKAENYANDELFPYFTFPPIHPDHPELEKGPTPNDERHHVTVAATYRAPWDIQLSGIFSASSSVPFDILLPDGSSRVPVFDRNVGAREFTTGAQLNAA